MLLNCSAEEDSWESLGLQGDQTSQPYRKSVLNIHWKGFHGGSDGKESACSAADSGLIPGSGRSPGEGNDNPLQYSCLENPMDWGAWWATVHGIIRVRHDLASKPPPFIGSIDTEAPILWPPDAKSQLIRNDPDTGKVWGQEEKGMTEDEMVECFYQLNGLEFEVTLGHREGQRSLARSSPWGCTESDTTERLNNVFA